MDESGDHTYRNLEDAGRRYLGLISVAIASDYYRNESQPGQGTKITVKVPLVGDVVLMDLAMPIMGGLEATRRIRREFPGVRVLALTQYDDSEYVIPIIEAGARGFVTKMAAFSELALAIQAAYRGDSFLSPTAAAALVEECQQKTSAEGEQDSYQKLTDREREVLKLVAEGHTAREIAEMLVVSPKTVEWYKTSLMNKLKIHNRTDLIKFAIRKRVITL